MGGRLRSSDGPLRFVKAHAFGGEMTPRFIVLHDTAGALRKFSSVEWFASSKCKTSADFVVEVDGTITQMVPTNCRAYHAGVSAWKGVSGLNSCSVGIEIVNPGKLDQAGKADFGPVDGIDAATLLKIDSVNHGKGGYWLPYTPQQIEAVIAICRAITEEYPDCNEIVTHYQISPKRKIDVGPQFPLDEVRQRVFDPTPGEIEQVEMALAPPPPTKSPTMLAVASSSWSARTLIAMIWTAVCDFFFGIFEWVGHGLDWVVAIAKDTAAETSAALMPLATLAGTLKFNLGKVTLWLTVAFLGVVLARHVRDKVELTKLKQQLPPAQPAPGSTP